MCPPIHRFQMLQSQHLEIKETTFNHLCLIEVAAGFALGATSAAMWQLLYGVAYLPAAAADVTGRLRLCLYTLTALAAAVCLRPH